MIPARRDRPSEEPAEARGTSDEGEHPAERAADTVRRSKGIRVAARIGLVARGLFYLLLAGLAVNLLVGVDTGGAASATRGRAGSGAGQANANGALSQVAQTPVGLALLVGAAVGFAMYGGLRILGAATDDQPGTLRRLSTAGQGLLYLAMAWITASFLLGRRSTGSEQQQHSTAGQILGLPFGRPLLAAIGLVVLGMCAWQLVVAARGHFEDTLETGKMSRRVRWWTTLTGRIGIPARALAVAPIGVFLVVAAIRADPEQAKGLDAVLLQLTGSVIGRALIILVATGFVIFAIYSLFEARYRQLVSGA